jgi:hypothetical protein
LNQKVYRSSLEVNMKLPSVEKPESGKRKRKQVAMTVH